MKKSGITLVLCFAALVSFAQSTEGISAEGKSEAGKKIGKWVYTCDATGKVVGKESYNGEGELDGYVEWYTCDGKRVHEYNYSNGIKMGEQKEYHADGKLKREWTITEMPKDCQKSKEDKGKRIVESYLSYYENGLKEIEMEGDPCGRHKITKFRSTNGTEWIIEYDDDNNYKFGPKEQERALMIGALK